MSDESIEQEVSKSALESQTESEIERPSILKSAALMSVATLFSKASGFIRTWAMALALGNTLFASSYQVAANLSMTLFDLICGGILSMAFLPVFMQVQADHGKKKAWEYASNLFNVALIGLGIIVLFATIFAPQFIMTQTFMTGGEDAELAVYFFRFFAINILFYGLSALLTGLLNANRSYFWPNFATVFNNLTVALTMIVYIPLSATNPEFAKVWLAAGTVLGVFLMMAVQIPPLIKVGITYIPKIDLRDAALKATALIALPIIFYTLADFAAVSVRNAFALNVTTNGPSTVAYAWMWYQMPYGLIAAAVTTTMFTELADFSAHGKWESFKESLISGLRTTAFLILPLAALLMALATPLISLYHAGQFNADDIRQVAQVLAWWGTTLPLFAVSVYLYKAFAALKQLGFVTKVNVALRVLCMGMYAVFMSGIGSFEGWGLIGIPIADTIFYICFDVAMIIALTKRVGTFIDKGFAWFIVKASIAAVLSGLLSYGLFICLFNVEGMSIARAIFTLVICGSCGLAAFFILGKLLKIPENKIAVSLLRKLWNKLARKKEESRHV